MKEIIRVVLREYMELRWGVHGALKPPLGYAPWTRPKGWRLFWYRWRVFCWRIENRIYGFTHLPRRWHLWMQSPQNKEAV